MKIYKSISELKETLSPVALTIGTFDGLHLGHEKLFNTLLNTAKKNNASPWVLTFSNLPYEVFNPGTKHNRLLDIESKINLLAKKGMEGVILIDFTKKFGKLNGIDFCRRLREKFANLIIVVGYDFKMGRNAVMSARELKEKGESIGFEVHIEPPALKQGKKISSTWIRSLIKQGDIEEANRLLARPYFIKGIVEKREGKGKEIGFPTANIRNDQMVYPEQGVYLTRVQIADKEKIKSGETVFDGKYFDSMTFVGKNTLSVENPPAIETNIFGFEENLYYKYIKVYFYKKIRNTVKVNNYNELKQRLIEDKKKCLSLLEKSEELDVNH